MSSDPSSARVERVLLHARDDASGTSLFDRLCAACVTEFDLAGAGMSLIVAGEHHGVLSATDDWVTRLEDLQYTLGEGPCLDAHRGGLPVAVADLTDEPRWPLFAAAAAELGAVAAFAFPLQIGSARFGTLDFFRRSTGDLSRADYSDAADVADVATVLLIDAQADVPPGGLGEEVEGAIERSTVVNQAAGMITVQLDLSIEDAHVALRARAFSDGRRIREVAADVVARRIVFD